MQRSVPGLNFEFDKRDAYIYIYRLVVCQYSFIRALPPMDFEVRNPTRGASSTSSDTAWCDWQWP